MSESFVQSTADRFLVAIRAGASFDVAADHAGVGLDMIREWLDDEDDEDCVVFCRAADQARADLELLMVGTVRRVASEDVSAAKWLAERVHADSELERLRRLTT